MLTVEEAKQMQGVEFTYVFRDGDTIPCYVKKFDPEVGLTCLSLDTKTKAGWRTKDPDLLEADGTFCVIGIPADDLDRCLSVLEGIKEDGVFESRRLSTGGAFYGCVFS